MRLLGNKVRVRELAIKLGVPVVPGSEDSVEVAEARKIAREIGLARDAQGRGRRRWPGHLRSV